MSCGKPPARMLELDCWAGVGRRAAFNVPSGVEEAVIIVGFCDSGAIRRDGIRGATLVAAVPGTTLSSGEDDDERGDGGHSGAGKGALSDDEAMLERRGPI